MAETPAPIVILASLLEYAIVPLFVLPSLIVPSVGVELFLTLTSPQTTNFSEYEAPSATLTPTKT